MIRILAKPDHDRDTIIAALEELGFTRFRAPIGFLTNKYRAPVVGYDGLLAQVTVKDQVITCHVIMSDAAVSKGKAFLMLFVNPIDDAEVTVAGYLPDQLDAAGIEHTEVITTPAWSGKKRLRQVMVFALLGCFGLIVGVVLLAIWSTAGASH